MKSSGEKLLVDLRNFMYFRRSGSHLRTAPKSPDDGFVEEDASEDADEMLYDSEEQSVVRNGQYSLIIFSLFIFLEYILELKVYETTIKILKLR